MSTLRLFGVVLLVALSACATMRTRADEAYTRHDWEKASELYDLLVQQHPAERGFLARRAEARARALAARTATFHAERVRATLDDSVRDLATLLAARDRWPGDGDLPTRAAIAAEAAWARDRVTDELRALIVQRR